ncbi:hypothetical protein ACFUJU_13520 [Streptomyces sp. NPDC057235]|uniref:hypothetical protein n=1 Tax=Streptomyces sp. NPDC057235 TaxID=3346058 RepID=UPI00363CA713
MADPLVSYELSGLDGAPNIADAMEYARVLADRSGIVLPDDAELRITPVAGSVGQYRVEVLAAGPPPSLTA